MLSVPCLRMLIVMVLFLFPVLFSVLCSLLCLGPKLCHYSVSLCFCYHPFAVSFEISSYLPTSVLVFIISYYFDIGMRSSLDIACSNSVFFLFCSIFSWPGAN